LHSGFLVYRGGRDAGDYYWAAVRFGGDFFSFAGGVCEKYFGFGDGKGD